LTPEVRRLLGFISIALIIETAVYSTIAPLLPEMKDQYDLSKSAAGLLSASYAIGTLALSVPAALITSRSGPKRTLIGALALLGGGSLIFAVADSAALLTFARFLQGVGAGGVWASGLSWVIAIAPRERRAEALGTAIGAAIAGALGGPVLGTIADAVGRGVVFAGFALVPALLITRLVRMEGPSSTPTPGGEAFRAVIAEPLMRRGVLLMAIPAAAFGLVNVLVPLRMDAFGAGAVAIGAVFLAAVVLESGVSPIAGRMADRHGAFTPARIGLLTGGAAAALIPVAHAAFPLAIGVVVCCPLLGLLWAPAMAVLSDGAEARGIDSAFAFGLGNLAWGLGSSIGGSGGSALAEATTDAVPFVAIGAISVLAAVALHGATTTVPAPVSTV
jgi:predicted MFS family arabinose efflux permease